MKGVYKLSALVEKLKTEEGRIGAVAFAALAGVEIPPNQVRGAAEFFLDTQNGTNGDYYAGIIFENSGDYKNALEYYKKTGSQIEQARVLEKMGKARQAIRIYESIVSDFFSEEKYEDALKLSEEKLKGSETEKEARRKMLDDIKNSYGERGSRRLLNKKAYELAVRLAKTLGDPESLDFMEQLKPRDFPDEILFEARNGSFRETYYIKAFNEAVKLGKIELAEEIRKEAIEGIRNRKLSAQIGGLTALCRDKRDYLTMIRATRMGGSHRSYGDAGEIAQEGGLVKLAKSNFHRAMLKADQRTAFSAAALYAEKTGETEMVSVYRSLDGMLKKSQMRYC